MHPTQALAQALIACPSVTPEDAGCQALLAARLAPRGFHCETLTFGKVTNLWAKRVGCKEQPQLLFVFAGHTDVVPTGPESAWESAPFTPTVRENKLYGRGAADMKGALAAMVVSVEEFLEQYPEHPGSLGFLITSDEEGPATEGTVMVCEYLQKRKECMNFCLVGEPSSQTQLGDTIKNGRRGSLSGILTFHGVQGHIAYPQLAKNPIHGALAALAELTHTSWDTGNAYYPPTSLQISNIHAGTGAGNVIPGQLELAFNFRFSTASTVTTLKTRVEEILKRHAFPYTLVWTLNGEAFLTPEGKLSQAACQAIDQELGIKAQLSTTGGTSDGRFIASICPEVIEFGPINASIHQVNEHIALSDLEALKNIYRRILENIFISGKT